MRYMERGLGYHYPAGTPAPRTEYGKVTCEDCGYEGSGRLIHDLGTADLVPEVCPKCKDQAPAFGYRLRFSRDSEYSMPDPDDYLDDLRDYYRGA